MPKEPADLSDKLPNKPPTHREIHSLINEWENILRINDIAWEKWEEEKRCVYMIVSIDERRGFRIIWNEKESTWWIGERSGTF
jgi:hypothetical protein